MVIAKLVTKMLVEIAKQIFTNNKVKVEWKFIIFKKKMYSSHVSLVDL